MSSGAKVVTAYLRETTPGVTPAGTWKILTRTSFGVTPTFNTTENNEISDNRMSQGTAQTTVDVGGDVETKMRYGALDEFMASCFGAEWSSNTLTMGNERITFSLSYFASDVGIAGIARGAQVSAMNIQIPADDEVTVTTTFAATGWEDKADDTRFDTDPASDASQRRYSFKDVTNLKLNGIQVGDNNVCVDSFNLQFDNNVQTQRCIGNGDAFPGNIIPTIFTPSGSITLSWSKQAYLYWKSQQSSTAISFEFTLSNDDGSYTFVLPEMEISGDWPDGGSTDIIQVEISYTGRRVPPTITRAPAQTQPQSMSAPMVKPSVEDDE